jgi:hypothetical protein
MELCHVPYIYLGFLFLLCSCKGSVVLVFGFGFPSGSGAGYLLAWSFVHWPDFGGFCLWDT